MVTPVRQLGGSLMARMYILNRWLVSNEKSCVCREKLFSKLSNESKGGLITADSSIENDRERGIGQTASQAFGKIKRIWRRRN